MAWAYVISDHHKIGQRYTVAWDTSLPTITRWVRGTEAHGTFHFLNHKKGQRYMEHFTSYNHKIGQKYRGAWVTSLPTITR